MLKRLRQIIRREGGTVLACAAVLGLAMVAPASAQFFDFGFGRQSPQRSVPQHRGGFFPGFSDGFFGGGQQQQRRAAPPPRVENYAKPPAPQARETPAEQNVLVLGDAMADWLAYGLEDALSETPELGVIRKVKTYSGLIRYQPKGEPSDWAAAAKEILAGEHPDVIVVMLGLTDRIPIREAEKKPEKTTKDTSDKDAKGKKGDKSDAKPDAKPGDAKPNEAESDSKSKAGAANKPDDDKADADETPPDDDESETAPDKSARATNGVAEYHDDRWTELYTRKIEEFVTILKSKGVPIVWVGLPAVRGTKSTSDMLFLDSLYRDVAGKMGITYVDVWDGFVDDNGRYIQTGPDFEGQIRKLRTPDGVYFTKAGARKLAHYTEREIRRVLAARSGPITLPTEQPEPDNNVSAKPGEPAPRPLAGPVVPLVASSGGSSELLGGAGARPSSVDALAARTLVKGEPLSIPAGRADDFNWPRKQIGELKAPATSEVVATTKPAENAAPKPAAAPKPKRPAQAADSNQPVRPRGYVRPDASSSGFFFLFR